MGRTPGSKGSGRRRIRLDDIFAFRLPGSPDLSPDGSRCVLTVQRCGRKKNAYYTGLHMVDLRSGATRALTSGDHSDACPVWSPDGRAVAFVSDRSGSQQIHLLPMDGGEASKLTDLPEGAVSDLEWAPDGSRLAFVYRPACKEDARKERERRQKRHLSGAVRVVGSQPYRLDGVGFLSQSAPRIWVVEVSSQAARPITKGKLHTACPAWSPDGSRIAFAGVPDVEYAPWDAHIYLVAPDGGKPTCLPAPTGPKRSPAWSPDGARIAYLGYECAEDAWGIYNWHVWLAEAEGGPAVDLTAGVDLCFSDATMSDTPAAGSRSDVVFSEDGSAVHALAMDRGSTRAYVVPLAGGEPGTLAVGARAIHVYAHTRPAGGRTVLLAQTPTSPGEAHVVEGPTRAAKPITHLNDELIASLELTEPEELWVSCPDERKVQAWTLKPPGASRRKGLPLVLYIHGGPHMQYGAGFFHEFHWLAANGLAVLYSNPVGSKGRGEEHAQALRNAWGQADFPQLMAVVDAVLEQGWADPSRMGVAGGSYGGYMTNWVIAHTDRFACAVTQRCVTNLVSMAGSSDIPFRPDGYFAGNPWSRQEKLWELSPIRLLENIRTPLLILHSEGDLRCNVEQAEQLFAGLRTLRRRVRFVRFPREASHGLSRSGPPDLRERRLREVRDWFATALLDGAGKRGRTTEDGPANSSKTKRPT